MAKKQIKKLGSKESVPRWTFDKEGGEGGAKAIRAMPIWKQHISKRGFSHLRFVYREGMRLY